MTLGGAPTHEIVEDDGRLRTALSRREDALLEAALAREALLHPGRTIRLSVVLHDDGEAVRGVVTARSHVEGDVGTEAAVPVDVSTVIERDGLLRPDAGPGRGIRAALDRAATRWPLLGDAVKQRALAYGLARADRAITGRVAPLDSTALSASGAAERKDDVRRPAVLVGMYWLEHGGAEKWALDSVRMAREAGLHPVVVVDVPAAHSLAAHESLADATLLVVDDLGPTASETLLHSLLRVIELRGVVIHHSNWLYARLPLLRVLLPDVPVVDSLHVIEWENGGFPMVASLYDAFIDDHHVIAPHLQRYLVEVKKVDARKVVVAPLLRLGGSANPAREQSAPGGPGGEGGLAPVRVGFIGRAVPQKRPLLFVEVVAATVRRRPRREVRAVFHGDGPLVPEVRRSVARHRMEGAFEFRTSAVPVSLTYDEIDILVVCSQTEGLTLTTMEATRAGVLVLSADVGSQRVLVAPDLLLPRDPIAFLRRASRRIHQLAASPTLRARLLAEQRLRLSEFAELEDAEPWFESVVRRWATPVGEPSPRLVGEMGDDLERP